MGRPVRRGALPLVLGVGGGALRRGVRGVPHDRQRAHARSGQPDRPGEHPDRQRPDGRCHDGVPAESPPFCRGGAGRDRPGRRHGHPGVGSSEALTTETGLQGPGARDRQPSPGGSRASAELFVRLAR